MNRWRKLNRSMCAGGLRRRLLTLLVLVAVLITLLPVLVAKTPLLSIVLAAALPADIVRVTAREASLSWISGPSLSGIDVRDPDGNLLLSAERISIDRALVGLAVNWRDLGVLEIVRPAVHLKLRADGSNLEDIVHKLQSRYAGDDSRAEEEVGPPLPVLIVRLVDGSLLAEDTVTGRQWRVDGLNVQYDTRGGRGGLGRGSLSGSVRDGRDGAAVGRLGLSLEGIDGGEHIALEADGLPLVVAEPWLRRFAAGSELRGTLSARGSATWSAATFPGDLTTSGTLVIDDLEATSPALLGDRLRLARAELPWRLTSQPTGLAIEDLQLRSEIVQAALRGRLDRDMNALRHDLELRGTVDVARLAAMLPNALHVREGITITSGSIELAGRYRPDGEVQHINGSLRTSPLAATSGERSLRWEQPVSANFALRRENDVLQLDRLQCSSQFLTIGASGNWQQFTASASFDLNRLAEQLGQFIELGDAQLAGTGEAGLEWRQAADDQFTATATGDLRQLAVALGAGGAWEEPELAIRADASGRLDPQQRQPNRIDSAKLHVGGQGDELDIRLVDVVDLTDEAPEWPLAVRASGRVARWLTRARPWFAAEAWQVDGQGELTAELRLAGGALEAHQATLAIRELTATGPDWTIREPRVQLAGDARWDGASGTLTSGTTQLVTSTVSLATEQVRYQAGVEGIGQLSGAAAFRANLARLASWQAPSEDPGGYLPQGELTGNLRFVQQGNRITGEVNASGQNLALAGRSSAANVGRNAAGAARQAPTGYEIVWQEPTLTLRGAAEYDAEADRLTFNQFQIQSTTLQAVVGGQVQNLVTAADVNLKGTLNYDLAQITPLLRPYLGQGVRLSGREQARFAVVGKLAVPDGPRAHLTGATPGASPGASGGHWSRRIRAELELPWGGANVYGLPIGGGRLATQLSDGSIRFEALTLEVGEGRLTAAPHVRLDPPPSELTLPAGPLLSGVRISPEVSETMLKYVAPVLAGATETEGHFSLALEATRVPLAEPKRADSAGRLTVHSVRVVPGAFAREIIGVAQQVEAIARRRDPSSLATRPPVTLLSIRDQEVAFRVADGRVHHQDMEFQVGEVTVRSQGSVGFDETLALTLQVPIQDAWIASQPLLASLKGQSLQVPVSGTLARPQLDRGAVASLSAQLLQNAAGQAIGDEVNKALERLFQSR